TGLLRCGKCQGRLVFALNGRTKTPSYRCPKVQGNENCGQLSIVSAPLEELLAELLFRAHNRLDDTIDESAGSRADWEAKHQALSRRKSELAKAFGAGAIELSEWMDAKKVIEDEMNALPAPPKSNSTSQRITGDDLRASWPSMSASKK